MKKIKIPEEVKYCNWFQCTIGKFFLKLKRAIKYFVVGWKEYDFEFEFGFLRYTKMKLTAYKNFLESGYAIAEHEDDELNDLARAIEIIERIQTLAAWDENDTDVSMAHEIETKEQNELFDLLNKNMGRFWD